MRKSGVCFSTIVICSFMAGIYGILHDQLSYSLSAEYFTQYKFQMYQVSPIEFGGDRMAVTVTGFRASWWLGLIIGTGIGFTACIFDGLQQMKQYILLAVLIVLLTTIIMGIAGYLYGEIVEVQQDLDRRLVRHLVKPVEYIVVGSIQQRSYFGALLGLLLAISFLFRQKAKTNFLEANFAV
jgi:hypothetical protein